MLGVYWGDWTLRELVHAWEGRLKSQWGIESVGLCLFANANRDPKKSRPFKPADFNPFYEKTDASARVPLTSDNIHLLKSFVRQ